MEGVNFEDVQINKTIIRESKVRCFEISRRVFDKIIKSSNIFKDLKFLKK